MRNFSHTFETRKQSFSNASSIRVTVTLIANIMLQTVITKFFILNMIFS